MIHIKIPQGWEIPESEATPEEVYLNRRKFLKAMGFARIGTLGWLAGCQRAQSEPQQVRGPLPGLPPASRTSRLYPAKRNERFTVD